MSRDKYGSNHTDRIVTIWQPSSGDMKKIASPDKPRNYARHHGDRSIKTVHWKQLEFSLGRSVSLVFFVS